MTMRVIGLGHKKFVGKDTCEKMMAQFFIPTDWSEHRTDNNKIYKISFADHMKDVCHMLYPQFLRPKEHYELYPQDKQKHIPELGMTVRDVWIKVGNKLREIDDHVWIRYAFYEAQRKHAKLVFCPDVRYPSEANYILGIGGILFKVTNNRIPNTDDVADCALDGFERWTEVIENNGTLLELEEKCNTLMSKHKSYILS